MFTQNYNNFLKNRETAQNLNNRLKIFINEYANHRRKHNHPLKILDIGCGKDPQILNFVSREDLYSTCDYYESINKQVYSYKQVDLNCEKLSEKFPNQKFDVIFCGEVIEHLFSPDYMLAEIKKLMHKDSILILSTPNLGYYVNRLMLLVGISPLYLENSSEYKLGRKFRIFGQGNTPEGHIKVFTYGALLDLFKIQKFTIIKTISCSTWSFFLDKFISKFSKSLAAANVFILKKTVRK